MKIEDMQIYKDSIDLAKWFRELFKIMNKDDQFSIGQQMLRSSVSISSNIAEGIGRNSSNKMLLTYLGYSRGSLYEFKAQLTIIKDDYIHSEVIKILDKKIPLLEEGIGKFIVFVEKKL
jgi:four helix bundle protein